MRNQLIWIRALTATVLFIILSQANIWANTNSHLVLAVGYRAFLVCAPLFVYFGITKGFKWALGLGALAVGMAFFSVNEFVLGLFALSMAVTGYIAKYVTSQTSQGSADNKVALNMGSLGSGILLMCFNDKNILLGISIGMLIVSMLLAFKLDLSFLTYDDSKTNSSGHTKIKLIPLIGWILIGIASGIKLTGIFTILPQYLILKNSELPFWYGSLIIINSLGVILIQHRVLKILDLSANSATHIAALSAMILLALPAIMKTENIYFAVVWVILLTIGECALSRYDRLAKLDGYLFPKELMVGVGSFLTVALSRNYPEAIYWSGVVGVICLISGIFLVRQNSVGEEFDPIL